MDNLPTVTTSNSILSYVEHLDKQLQFADVLLRSKLVPSHFQTKEAVYVALLWGQELGFSPVQATQSLEVIQGKVTTPAQTIKALVEREGGRVETVKWTRDECTLRMTRGDHSEEHTFTIQDAEEAQLLGKDNWKKNRKAMLYARCVSILGRNMYADVLKGLYSSEEMRDSVEVEFERVAEDRSAAHAAIIAPTPGLEQAEQNQATEALLESMEKTSKLAQQAQAIKKEQTRKEQIKELVLHFSKINVPERAIKDRIKKKSVFEMAKEDYDSLIDIGHKIRSGEPAAQFFNLEFLESAA
jgi:hypothetical protein